MIFYYRIKLGFFMSNATVKQLLDIKIVEVNNLILAQLNSPVELVNTICAHLITSGGKRIRPRLILLVAEMLKENAMSDKIIQSLAAALEIIHTATLLHDDVIDESTMRRGKDSTNKVFGNTLAVLGGDFLFTKAFSLSTKVNCIGELFSNTISVLVQGEIEQMSNISDTKMKESTYFHTIYSKTSILFECAAQLPGIYYKIDQKQIELLKNYGRYIGNAFQIADDILDYTANSESLGKNIGDDLAEEKITLPLIYAFNKLDNLAKKELEQAIKDNDITSVIKFVRETGAIELCYQRAQLEIDNAIDSLKDFNEGEYKNALIELAKLTINRQN